MLNTKHMPPNRRKMQSDSRIGLRLPGELRAKLEAMAARDQRTLSNMIIKLLTDATSKGGK